MKRIDSSAPKVQRSQQFLRRRRGFLIALCLTIAFIYFLPFLNLAAQHKAHSLAYKNHVSPQIAESKPVIELNSRLLPRFKFENLSRYVDVTRPTVLWVGNSTQFHIRRPYLEQGFRCKIDNFYNMSYHSPDPDDINRMLKSVGDKLQTGSTIVLAIYPEMFTHFARINAPSLLHPWGTVDFSFDSLSLWLKNIRDANTSFVSLFTNFIRLEWPLAPFSNFPFVTYYQRLFDLIEDGFADEYVFEDGSVEFIGAEKRNEERNARNELIYFDHHVFARHASSPLSEDLFDNFNEIVENFTSKNINVVAFEVVLHPQYSVMRRTHEHRKVFEKIMGNLDSNNEKFYFYPRNISNIKIRQQLWLDETHVSFEGGRRIAAHHGTYMNRAVIC